MLARTQYAILGVAQTESHEGLRRVFRQLVKRYHPDRAGLGATAAFQQIINAYRTLERAEWRMHYNKGIDDVLQRQPDPEPAPILAEHIPSEGAAVPQIVPGIELRVLSLAALESLARRIDERLHRPERAAENEWGPLDLTATLTAAAAARGGLAILVLPAWRPCAECRGSGWVGTAPCQACDGEAIQLEEARIHVKIPPLSSAYTRLELPAPHMGLLGKYLRLHLRVV